MIEPATPAIVRVAKPEVLWDLELDRPGVLEASAGTGKTYALEHLVLDLVLRAGARVDEILVVTFTERATAELRSRIRGKLHAMANLSEPAAAALADGRTFIIDREARARLHTALADFDRASISTIHAFCQRVLVDHAFLHRRLLSQKNVDGRLAFDAAFLAVLRRELSTDERLRPWLVAWLEGGRDADQLGDLLYRCHDVASPLRPVLDEDALSAALIGIRRLGLTEATLGSLRLDSRSRVKERLLELALAVDQLGGGLRGAQGLVDLPRFLRALDACDAGDAGRSRARQLVELFGAQHAAARPGSPESLVLAAFLALARARVSFVAALAHRFFPVVAERVRRDKADAGLFDFHDLLSLVAESLDGPAGEALAKVLRARFPYALIDEFQDTDPLQWRIFRAIYARDGEAAGPLFVIGDPKQAIYGFRGADVRTYLGAVATLVEGGGQRRALRDNFRSTPRLLDAVNALLDQSAPDPFFQGEARYDEPVRCGEPERAVLDGAGAQAPPVVLFTLTAPRGDLAATTVGNADDDERAQTLRIAEARRALLPAIAAEIRAILQGALVVQGGAGGEPKKVGPSDIFILTRGGEEGREVGRALAAAGIAHAFYREEGLFQSREAYALRDLLRAIDDPSDRDRRLRAFSSPFFDVPLDALARCDQLPGTHALWQRLGGWKELAETRDYERLFPRILEESGFVRRARFAGGNARALTNVLHLCELMLAEGVRTRATLRELGQSLDAFIAGRRLPDGQSGNVQRLESDRQAVQIMTIHKAKGLEAEVVFLYGGYGRGGGYSPVRLLHEGALRVGHVGPPRDSETKEVIESEALAEEERLLYVALTRAKSRLYLAHFPPGLGAQLSPAYQRLNTQLHRVTGSTDFGLDEDRGSFAELFAVRPLVALRPGELPDNAPPPVDVEALAAWTPPASALAAPAPGSFEPARLRAERAGFFVTSYSRMKAAHERARAEVERADFRVEPYSAAPPQGADELPAGAATGVFLHELLEHVASASFLEAPDFASWRSRAEVSRLVTSRLNTHGQGERFAAHALRLVWGAFTTPVGLRPGAAPRPLARATRLVREVEFLFPFPEPGHPRLGDRVGERVTIHRGFVKGFVDLIFEADGLVYFGDWKSDVLASYDGDALAEHVRAFYSLQARLYAMALVKMLGIRGEDEYQTRFGGVLYLFVRGMAEGVPAAGVSFERPEWSDLRRFEAALADGGSAEPDRLSRPETR